MLLDVVEWVAKVGILGAMLAGLWWAIQDKVYEVRKAHDEHSQRDKRLEDQLEGVGSKLSREIKELRADHQESEKEVWKEMAQKADKEALKQHRIETSRALSQLRSDMQDGFSRIEKQITKTVKPMRDRIDRIHDFLIENAGPDQ